MKHLAKSVFALAALGLAHGAQAQENESGSYDLQPCVGLEELAQERWAVWEEVRDEFWARFEAGEAVYDNHPGSRGIKFSLSDPGYFECAGALLDRIIEREAQIRDALEQHRIPEEPPVPGSEEHTLYHIQLYVLGDLDQIKQRMAENKASFKALDKNNLGEDEKEFIGEMLRDIMKAAIAIDVSVIEFAQAPFDFKDYDILAKGASAIRKLTFEPSFFNELEPHFRDDWLSFRQGWEPPPGP